MSCVLEGRRAERTGWGLVGKRHNLRKRRPSMRTRLIGFPRASRRDPKLVAQLFMVMAMRSSNNLLQRRLAPPSHHDWPGPIMKRANSFRIALICSAELPHCFNSIIVIIKPQIARNSIKRIIFVTSLRRARKHDPEEGRQAQTLKCLKRG